MMVSARGPSVSSSETIRRICAVCFVISDVSILDNHRCSVTKRGLSRRVTLKIKTGRVFHKKKNDSIQCL